MRSSTAARFAGSTRFLTIYLGLTPQAPNGFASKIGSRTWIGSVQGAVATWSVISMRCS